MINAYVYLQVQDLVSDCLAYLKKTFTDQVVFDTFIEAQRLQISSLRTDAIEILIEGPRCATDDITSTTMVLQTTTRGVGRCQKEIKKAQY